MSFTLQLWDFDIDFDTLGPIRCRHFDASKKFREFEEVIQAGTVDDIALARDVFQTVARRRTGDAAIDARCGGAKFSDEEVSSVTLAELDQFCDTLLKGRLRLSVAAAEDPPTPPSPVFPTGREGLAPALQHFDQAQRASMARLVRAAKRGSQTFFDFEQAVGGRTAMRAIQEAYRNENAMNAALGSSSMASVQRAWEEGQRREDIFRASAGLSGQVGSFLDQGSVCSAAVNSIAQESLKKSLGLPDHIEVFLRNQINADAAIRSVTGPSSLTAQIPGFTSETRAAIPVSNDLAESPSRLRHLPPYTPPPNPIHKTNDKLDELLAHRKAEAAKKDSDRAGAALESGESKKVSSTGLTYTKVSTWFAIIATVLAAWIYVESKIDAAEAAKKERGSDIQIEELRAEIRLLRAKELATDKPAAQLDSQAASKANAQLKQKVATPSSKEGGDLNRSANPTLRAAKE